MTLCACSQTGENLLSVVVTSCNQAEYLRECLESVLRQTYRPLEILVADDASVDGSVTMLKEYEAAHPGTIFALCNARNIGVARNRHYAITKARGRWFVTLDGDDAFQDPRKLELEMSTVLDHQARKGQEIAAYSDILILKTEDSSSFLASATASLREGFILPEILGRSCMIPRDFVISRDAYFAVGGYDFELPIYEDWDLKIRFAERFPFYYTGCVGTIYRRHGRGLSAAPPQEHRYWLERIFTKNHHRVPAGGQERARADFDDFLSRIR